MKVSKVELCPARQLVEENGSFHSTEPLSTINIADASFFESTIVSNGTVKYQNFLIIQIIDSPSVSPAIVPFKGPKRVSKKKNCRAKVAALVTLEDNTMRLIPNLLLRTLKVERIQQNRRKYTYQYQAVNSSISPKVYEMTENLNHLNSIDPSDAVSTLVE